LRDTRFSLLGANRPKKRDWLQSPKNTRKTRSVCRKRLSACIYLK
jgi:hypothetical protein